MDLSRFSQYFCAAVLGAVALVYLSPTAGVSAAPAGARPGEPTSGAQATGATGGQAAGQPRQAYVLSASCAADLLGDDCGAGVSELAWANLSKMCGAESADNATCTNLQPALPDCGVQAVACFPNVEREAISAAVGNLCSTNPGAPGCSSVERGGDGCLNDPACTGAVTSDACAEGGGGICSSLENTLTNFGRSALQVDRSTQQGLSGGATGIALAYRITDNTDVDGDYADSTIRTVLFDGSSIVGPTTVGSAADADLSVGFVDDGVITAFETPPGFQPQDLQPASDSTGGFTFETPTYRLGEATNYIVATWTQVANSFSGGGSQTLRALEVAADGNAVLVGNLGPDPAEEQPNEPQTDPANPTSQGGISEIFFIKDVGLSSMTDNTGSFRQVLAPGLMQPFISNPGLSDPGNVPDLGLNLVANPDNFISVPNGRDATVQLMIVVEIKLTAAGRDFVPLPPAPAAPSLFSALRRVFSFRGLNASAQRGNAVWRSSTSSPLRPVVRTVANREGPMSPLAGRPGSGSGAQNNPFQMFLTNVGNSTGEAFTGHFLNNGDQPMDIDVKGLVVEPLKEEAQKLVQEQLQKILPENPLQASLDAYCLEFLRLPPQAEQMFQLAPKQLQDQFAPIRDLLDVSKQLNNLGLLPADSDPASYFHAINQWAIWTKEEGFSLDSFADAFVDHTRKQVEAAGNQWTSQFDEVLRGAAPARWANITRILETAAGR